jgi:hypothetical protein
MAHEGSPLPNVHNAAALLCVHPTTIRRWTHGNTVRGNHLPCTNRRVTREGAVCRAPKSQEATRQIPILGEVPYALSMHIRAIGSGKMACHDQTTRAIPITVRSVPATARAPGRSPSSSTERGSANKGAVAPSTAVLPAPAIFSAPR